VRADVARARRRWIREQGLLDPARLVFLDETAVTTSMVRLRGRAPRGIRVIGRVPLGAWKTLTFIAAMRHDKMTAPMAFEGAMTTEMFLAYLEQCLCPTLQRGDIVVIDNWRPHTSPRVREVIEKAGAMLRYLPKYSPDLNPIEMAYSKFKEFLRSAEARTVVGVYRAIRTFLPSLSAQECANYLRHAGYASI
jgi:transposase